VLTARFARFLYIYWRMWCR